MDVQEFDLRFDQRVLSFHAFVNTDRAHDPMFKAMLRAAKGPRLDASVAWLGGYIEGRAIWKEMIMDRTLHAGSQFDPPPLRDGCNRVLAFHMFVNTDAAPYHIHKAILRIARGDRLDACVVWAELYEGEDGRKAWSVCQDMAREAAANPNAKPYSLRDS